MMSFALSTLNAVLAIIISLVPVGLISLLSLLLIRWTSLSHPKPLTDEERQQKLSEIAQRVKNDRKKVESRARAATSDLD